MEPHPKFTGILRGVPLAFWETSILDLLRSSTAGEARTAADRKQRRGKKHIRAILLMIIHQSLICQNKDEL
jgi:hypothetical protein